MKYLHEVSRVQPKFIEVSSIMILVIHKSIKWKWEALGYLVIEYSEWKYSLISYGDIGELFNRKIVHIGVANLCKYMNIDLLVC